MNIQNINSKLIVVPTKIEDIQKLKAIDADYFIVDFIDEIPHCAIIGVLKEMERNGKEIIVMHRGGFIEGMLTYLKTVRVL